MIEQAGNGADRRHRKHEAVQARGGTVGGRGQRRRRQAKAQEAAQAQEATQATQAEEATKIDAAEEEEVAVPMAAAGQKAEELGYQVLGARAPFAFRMLTMQMAEAPEDGSNGATRAAGKVRFL